MKYRTIVADPPWCYNDQGGRHGIAAHYSGMPHEDLIALPLGEWAEDDAHLYLWTTNGFMEQAHQLARAWGFDQKTILTWIKAPGMGMGRYYRNTTEHVLFCVRGRLPVLRKDIRTHFTAPSGRHSQKPDSFYDLVETMSPGPYLDVFARRQRFGWDTWGNECFQSVAL